LAEHADRVNLVPEDLTGDAEQQEKDGAPQATN
jgi:hypothetical protein